MRDKQEHPEARYELRKAAYWYDDQYPGLGERFYDAIDVANQDIGDIDSSFDHRVGGAASSRLGASR